MKGPRRGVVDTSSSVPAAQVDDPGAGAVSRLTNSTDPAILAELKELSARVESARDGQFAENTIRSYRYWFDRYERWLTEPESRFRLRSAGKLSESALPVSEELLIIWLTDMVLGPRDEDPERFKWELTGPMAPSTLSIVVSAIQTISKRADNPWAPSVIFGDHVKGFRRQLAKEHEVQKARPLMRDELQTICAHLEGKQAPEVTRDSLIVELAAAGMSPSRIAALTVGSFVHPEGELWMSPPGESDSRWRRRNELLWESDNVVETTCVVDARGELWQLTTDAIRVAKVQTELAARAGTEPDGPLFSDLEGANPRARVSQILGRHARLCGWRNFKPSQGVNEELRAAMRSVIDTGIAHPDGARALRDQTLLVVGWLGALRRSEITALRAKDVTFGNGTVSIRIRFSKTDQEGKGFSHTFRTGQNSSTCPVRLLRKWQEITGTNNPDAPLFPVLDRHANNKETHLDGEAVSRIVRERVVQAGVETCEHAKAFRGHSLRRGFITQAAEDGHDLLVIQKHSRHVGIAMVAEYVDDARAAQNSLANKLNL